MAYDYREAMFNDIYDVLDEYAYVFEEYTDDGEIDFFLLEVNLFGTLWIDDSVIGYSCGSYTCNSSLAEENLCGNWDLMVEACDEFGETIRNSERVDVTIRCYLLGEVLHNVLNTLKEEIENGTAPEWLKELIRESIEEEDEEESI